MTQFEIERLAEAIVERLEMPCTVDKLAEETGFSKGAIREMVERGQLPYTRKGRRLMFSRSAVKAALTEEK